MMFFEEHTPTHACTALFFSDPGLLSAKRHSQGTTLP